MAPKRKPASEEPSDSEFDDQDLDETGSDYEEEEAPKPKKKPAAKKPAARKPAAKKQAAPKEEEGGEDEEAGSGKKPAKRPPRPKAQKITEVTTLPDGWTLHPPTLMYKLNPAAQGGKKVAAFDLDGTLVGTKSGRQFNPGPDDWKWYNKEVPGKLIELHDDGYQLVIFSNQGTIKTALAGVASQNVRGRVDNVLAALNKKAKRDIPVQVFMATGKDEYRKGEGTAMWDWFVANANNGVQPDLLESFYVGDAAGRATDINEGASSDKDFAAAIGIEFHLPEDKFGESDFKREVKGGESSGLNTAMATAFRQLADLCSGEPFKAGAFRKVAGVIDAHPTKITAAKELASVKGVGKSSLAKITEFLETGTLGALQEAGIEAGVETVDQSAEVGLKFL